MRTINERIKIIRRDFFNDRNNQFAEALGKTPQYVSNLCNDGKSVGKNVIASLTSLIPNLNIGWLLTGEGEMLKDTEKKEVISDSSINADKDKAIIQLINNNTQLTESIQLLAQTNAKLSNRILELTESSGKEDIAEIV